MLINIGALIIVAIIGAFLFSNYTRPPSSPTTNAILDTTAPPSETRAENPDSTLLSKDEEASVSHNTADMCQSLRTSFSEIEKIKQSESVDIRFVNHHKKVDGIVYRLRFFYKDSSENEIPNFLVYKENDNDEDILIEKSSYKKGKLYKKIEMALGETLYTEEGLNIGSDKNLFLHYENKKLKDLQGMIPNQSEKKDRANYIECRF